MWARHCGRWRESETAEDPIVEVVLSIMTEPAPVAFAHFVRAAGAGGLTLGICAALAAFRVPLAGALTIIVTIEAFPAFAGVAARLSFAGRCKTYQALWVANELTFATAASGTSRPQQDAVDTCASLNRIEGPLHMYPHSIDLNCTRSRAMAARYSVRLGTIALGDKPHEPTSLPG